MNVDGSEQQILVVVVLLINVPALGIMLLEHLKELELVTRF